MKKKILISLILTLVMLLSSAGAVFAGDTDISVEVSDIEVTTVWSPDIWWMNSLYGYNYWEGTVVNVSGRVDITCSSEASSSGFYTEAEASAESKIIVKVVCPDGTVVYKDIDKSQMFDQDSGLFWSDAEADASQSLDVNFNLYLNNQGEWVVLTKGEAEASWEEYSWFIWGWGESGYSSDRDSDRVVLSVWRVPDLPIPWMANGFTVYINDEYTNWKSSNWITILSRELESEIVLSADGITVEIPEGTVVNGNALCLANSLGVNYLNGKIYFDNANISFSNPVKITDSETGELLLEFTEIVNFQAQ